MEKKKLSQKEKRSTILVCSDILMDSTKVSLFMRAMKCRRTAEKRADDPRALRLNS